MISSQALAIIGILVSAAFGIWGVFLGLRKKRYPGELTFVEERYINLFNDIVRNINNLSILYKNGSISNNLVLLKGHLINTGSKDISPSMVGQELVAELSGGYKWVEAKIFNCSKKLKAKTVIASETILTFEFGLFRCSEYLSFEALVEVPNADEKKPSDQLRKTISWSHRIADTGKIKKQNIPTGTKSRKTKILESIQFGIMGIAAIITLITTNYISDEKVGYSVFYEIFDDAQKEVTVKILPQDKDTILLKDPNGTYRKLIDTDSFNKKYRPILKIHGSKPDILIINGLMSIMLFTVIIGLGIQLYRSIRARKFLKIINYKNDQTSCEPNI